MNLARAFVAYLETTFGLTFGQDIFIGEAPDSLHVPQDAIYWVVASGGNIETALSSGEAVKSYQLDIFRRDREYDSVYDDMQNMEELLNCSACVALDGYETIEVSATTFPIDDDLDDEDRKVGLIQATIRVYKTC